MSKSIVGILCLLLLVPFSAGAQPEPEDAKRSLKNKHRVEVGVSLLSEMSSSNEVTAGAVTVKSDAGGVAAFVAYTYYFSPDFGFDASVGFLDAEVSTSVTGSGAAVETGSVVPLLFGVKYQPSKLAGGDVLRPYASVAIGPYIGSASNVRAGTTTGTESYTETALGSRLGIGLDLLLGKYVTIGIGIGYHLVTDFEKRIGAETNYSSADFALSFGIIFGG